MQESVSMKISCQNKVEEIIDQIIGVYLEENIRQEGVIPGSNVQGIGIEEDEEDEDENFQKREKT